MRRWDPTLTPDVQARLQELCNCRNELCDRIRLKYDSIDQIAGFLWNLAAGEHDNPNVRPTLLDRGGDVVTVHSGHVEVEDYAIDRKHHCQREPFFRRCCRENVIAPFFEQRSFILQNDAVIIDAEDGSLRSSICLTQ